MVKKYKLSMFNYYVNCENEVRLYNSLYGANSLHIFRNKNIERIHKIFLDEDYSDELLVEYLKKFGFIVENTCDEKLLREQKYNDVINQKKLFLVIMPTENCNFNCVYCYEEHKNIVLSSFNQKAIINFVRKNIKEYTGLNVAWFGGEPLLNIDIIKSMSNEFINICKVARKPYKSGITTNGYLLSGNLFKTLYDLHIREYQITIDGNKITHDKQRPLKNGRGSYNKIISNLFEIKSLYKQSNAEIIIRINLTKEIITDISAFLKLMESLYDDKRFSCQINIASDWGGENISNFRNKLINNKDYLQIFKNLIDQNIKINFAYHLQELTAPDFKCYAARKNAYTISADGMIYKCTGEFDLDLNKIGYISKDGNIIIDKNKEALWTSLRFKMNNKKCIDCSYSGCCLFSPCPKNTILNDFTPTCPRTKDNVINLIKLMDKMYFKECEV